MIDASPADLRARRLDADTLRRRNPSLIHVWMPPHATRGSVAELPADELLLSAWTGVADQQPGALDQPVAPVVSIAAYERGALGATAIVAALLRRQKTGLGRGITVSGLHAVAALNVSTMVDLPGILRPFAGEKSTTWGPPNYRVYRCGDDTWLYLAALTAPFFIAALDALDMMDVMVMPGVDGEFLNVFLPDIKPVVATRLANRFMERSGAAWHDLLNSVRVPNALVQSREEWAASETVSAGEMLVEVAHETLGDVVMPAPAVELCASPARAAWLTDREALVDPADVWVDERQIGDPGDPRIDDRLPLDGLRVLDVSSFIAGPFTSSVLENFGATVFKVEQTTGDPFGEVARATYASLNRGKSRVVLDLKTADGLGSFHALAHECDAVIDNMSFGSAEKLGIDFETLARRQSTHCRVQHRRMGEGPAQEHPRLRSGPAGPERVDGRARWGWRANHPGCPRDRHRHGDAQRVRHPHGAVRSPASREGTAGPYLVGAYLIGLSSGGVHDIRRSTAADRGRPGIPGRERAPSAVPVCRRLDRAQRGRAGIRGGAHPGTGSSSGGRRRC